MDLLRPYTVKLQKQKDDLHFILERIIDVEFYNSIELMDKVIYFRTIFMRMLKEKNKYLLIENYSSELSNQMIDILDPKQTYIYKEVVEFPQR